MLQHKICSATKEALLKAGMLCDANEEMQAEPIDVSVGQVAAAPGSWAVVNDAAGQTSKWPSRARLPLPKTPSPSELMVMPTVFQKMMYTRSVGPPPLRLRHDIVPSTSGHVPPRPIPCACSPKPGRPVKCVFASLACADVVVGQVVAAPFSQQRGVVKRSIRPKTKRWWQRAAVSFVAVGDEAVVAKPRTSLKLRHGIVPSNSGHVPLRPIPRACSPKPGRPVKCIFASLEGADVSVRQVVAAPGSGAFSRQRGVAKRSLTPIPRTRFRHRKEFKNPRSRCTANRKWGSY